MIKNLSITEFAQSYLNIFIVKMLDKNSELKSKWNNSRGWTRIHMLEVFYCLAEEMRYRNRNCNEKSNDCPVFWSCEKKSSSCYGKYLQKEYYRVDLTLYNFKETGFWTLDYAIEHENEEFKLKEDKIVRAGWFNEFAKLLPIKCAKARVIVGYDYFDGNGEEIEKKFSYCKRLLERHAACPKDENSLSNSLSEGKILLIIFPRTKRIRQIREMEKVSNKDLVRIVEFEVKGKSVKQNDLTDRVCEGNMTDRLLQVYNII